jgi:hypothetical protein
MQATLPLAVLAIAASSLCSQSVTSPKGFDTTEGNAVFYHWGGNRRFQQIDASHIGLPRPIRTLAWRRDALGGGSGATARTFDLEVKMANKSFAVQSLDMDLNLAGATTVFPKANVNFPDWTQVPPAPPAPFDFVVTLSAPFVYLGIDGLLIDFSHDNASSTTIITMDRDYGGPISGAGALLGTGCVATGRTAAFGHRLTLENNGPTMPRFGMRLRVNSTNAPSTSPIYFALAASDSNLSLPGLCSNVRALPVFVLPLGFSDAAGLFQDVYLSFAYDISIQGQAVVTQLIGLDSGQPGLPFVVSNGAQATMPSTFPAAANECVYAWTTLPNRTGTRFYGGGAIIRLGI